ncbi:branched-chain amino acid ABC transporter permease [Duganella dendranthematis]|jgi:predicted branched-subunit amino acid permease|uniref:Branched-chain amino acid ABC transporter permease n=1 Tax=Duganella dendranthematis TaxID=2728021 RepID=A0ABX6M6S1_9BURK|nr:AzlC family ABC transporter permease [Duganella dendranthematis]QJD89998.1 branched-chain amino acid ABC transporter permease [Duganella dendranthematis]
MIESSPAAAAPCVATHHEPSWRAGVKTGLPSLFGIGAWGLVVGIAMVKSGLTIPQALGMTLVVFAGSAQLAALPLIAADAPIWVIFVTALVVNLRFVIFSALLAPHFAHLPWRQRLTLGYVSGDISVALFLQKYPSPAPEIGKLSYLKGLLYPNWASWQIGSIAGVLLGSVVPPEWNLSFAGTLAIICVMVPLTAGRPALCGVLVAGAVSVLAHGLPYKLGLLAAVLAGMLSAMLVGETAEKLRSKHG